MSDLPADCCDRTMVMVVSGAVTLALGHSHTHEPTALTVMAPSEALQLSTALREAAGAIDVGRSRHPRHRRR